MHWAKSGLTDVLSVYRVDRFSRNLRDTVTPPGYDKDKATEHLYVDEAEAAVVRLIFDLYTKDRLGSQSIAHELNERDYRTRKGGLWAFKRILTILENRVYVGEIHFRGVVAVDAHPGIIDPEQFEEAQRIMDERGDNHANSAAIGSDYIATGRLPARSAAPRFWVPGPPARPRPTATTRATSA